MKIYQCPNCFHTINLFESHYFVECEYCKNKMILIYENDCEYCTNKCYYFNKCKFVGGNYYDSILENIDY